MHRLILATLIWAFSFGIIRDRLTALNSSSVAFLRLIIAAFACLVFFRSFIKIRSWYTGRYLKFFWIGSIQFGLMYICYIAAFKYLKAYEVAICTIFTPFYIILIDRFQNAAEHIRPRVLISLIMAIIGAGLTLWNNQSLAITSIGFVLVQISNISFAFGQLEYRRQFKRSHNQNEYQLMFLAYLGGAALALLPALFSGALIPDILNITTSSLIAILYLGVIASGVGFWLWNTGAHRVSAARLAVMNNLKIPLAVVVSMLAFGETGNWLYIVPGLVLTLVALQIKL